MISFESLSEVSVQDNYYNFLMLEGIPFDLVVVIYLYIRCLQCQSQALFLFSVLVLSLLLLSQHARRGKMQELRKHRSG